MMPRLLRALAIVIAVAAIIDPAVTTMRTTRPEVALVAADSAAERETVARVARELGERFTVIPAPFAAAAATVILGRHLPAASGELAAPVFAMAPGSDRPTVTIEAVEAPAHAALDARLTIVANVRAVGANGRTVQATLSAGDVIVHRASRAIASNDERVSIPLAFVPTAPGAVRLRATVAVLAAGADTTSDVAPADARAADIVVDIRDARWSVLFHDPRPSWQSTFVRRAIERDPRFVVTSRIITSRNLSTDAGQPPGSLDDLATTSLHDAIVIGAPAALSYRDIAGLDRYLRGRGGAVILLLDEPASGPFDRLTGVRSWGEATGAAGFTIRAPDTDSGGLRATAIAWPATLPPGARAIALSSPPSSSATANRAVIWRSAVGPGELVVSGALDAWRYRDPQLSDFDGFWRATIANAAASSAPPVELSLNAGTFAPGERAIVTAAVRDASLATRGATGTAAALAPTALLATIESPGRASVPDTIRLRGGGDGHFGAEFRTPASPGAYRLIVTNDGFRAEAPFVVSATAARASADDSDLIAAWVRSRGGEVIAATALDELVPALERAVKPIARAATWYPMRSPWWIVPFALLLGTEWLWRRRRGSA